MEKANDAPRIVEAVGTASGEARSDGSLSIIVEAVGRATGSSFSALRSMHAALADEEYGEK